LGQLPTLSLTADKIVQQIQTIIETLRRLSPTGDKFACPTPARPHAKLTDKAYLFVFIVENHAGTVVAVACLSAFAFISTHDTGDRHEIL
jgi:hypothetical protein